MSSRRYSISFLVSSILFALVGFSLFLLAQRVEKPKQLSRSVIKVAIITPVVKKVIEKKPKPPVIVPPIPLPPKVQKKIEPKKIIKKRVIKKKIIRKKIIKKRVLKKKVKKKKIVKKKILKKRVVKRKLVKKRVIKKIKPKRVEPIVQEVYIPTPQPKRVIKPVIKVPVHRKVPTEPKRVDKSAEKRQFLSQVRSKIIANKRYPKMALRRHIQGAVKIKFDITSSGNVSNIRYINGKKILQKGARKAIEKSFPITIPSYLRSELPIRDIYLTIHFNIH
jgi:protein TonB